MTVSHSHRMALKTLSPIDFEFSLYLRLTARLGIDLINSFNFTLLNDQRLLTLVSRLANKIDTAYNEIYGGAATAYTSDAWQTHFTDDFWTLFFLVRTQAAEHPKFVHLAWLLSRFCNLSPFGPTSYTESKATMILRYGDEPWAECTIRDRRHQLVPFHALGEEQKKDDIPTKAFAEIVDEFGIEYIFEVFTPFFNYFDINAFPL